MITVSTSLDRQAQDRMPDEWLASPTGDADIVAGDYPIGIAGYTEKIQPSMSSPKYFSFGKLLENLDSTLNLNTHSTITNLTTKFSASKQSRSFERGLSFLRDDSHASVLPPPGLFQAG